MQGPAAGYLFAVSRHLNGSAKLIAHGRAGSLRPRSPVVRQDTAYLYQMIDTPTSPGRKLDISWRTRWMKLNFAPHWLDGSDPR